MNDLMNCQEAVEYLWEHKVEVCGIVLRAVDRKKEFEVGWTPEIETHAGGKEIMRCFARQAMRAIHSKLPVGESNSGRHTKGLWTYEGLHVKRHHYVMCFHYKPCPYGCTKYCDGEHDAATLRTTMGMPPLVRSKLEEDPTND